MADHYSGAVTVQRRRVQRLDHLNDCETNAVVNRMFMNAPGFMCDYTPWSDNWQCGGETSKGELVREDEQVLRAKTNQMYNSKRQSTLKSVYGANFDSGEVLSAAKKAGATPKC